MLFALDICVNKAPSTHSVHWDLNPLPPQKHHPFFFSFFFLLSPLLNLKTIQATFLGDSHPSKKIVFSCTPPPHPTALQKIGFFSELPQY